MDLYPDKLAAYGISPSDVSNAVNAQSLILPAGSAKIGTEEYQVRLNTSPATVAALNDLPMRRPAGPRSVSAIWLACATGSRCRPTSSMPMANAAC